MGNSLCGGDRAHARYITSDNIAAIDKNIQTGMAEWKVKYVARIEELQLAWRSDAENQRDRLQETSDLKQLWAQQAQNDTGFEYAKRQLKERVQHQFWVLIKGKMTAGHESDSDKATGKAACERMVETAVEQVRARARFRVILD